MTLLSNRTPTTTPTPPTGRGHHRRILTGRAVVFYTVTIALAAIFIFPLYWALVSSFKPESEAAATPPTYLPHHLTTSAYSQLGRLGAGGVMLAVRNSLEVTGISIVLTVVISTMAGYAFSRFKFRGRGLLFFGILFTLMIPFQSILIPLYEIFTAVHLTNSMFGLALLYTTFQLPFSTFVMRNTFDALPVELDEAALVDGCGTLRTLVRVLVPSAYPGMLTVALFTFLYSWNELLAALIMVTDASKFTLPVMLSLVLANQFGTVVWSQLQAGVVVAMIPCLAVFALLQRYYIGGVTAGSVKG